MIGGFVEWADGLFRSFARPRLSAEARVEPAEKDDIHTVGKNPEPWAEAGAVLRV